MLELVIKTSPRWKFLMQTTHHSTPGNSRVTWILISASLFHLLSLKMIHSYWPKKYSMRYHISFFSLWRRRILYPCKTSKNWILKIAFRAWYKRIMNLTTGKIFRINLYSEPCKMATKKPRSKSSLKRSVFQRLIETYWLEQWPRKYCKIRKGLIQENIKTRYVWPIKNIKKSS